MKAKRVLSAAAAVLTAFSLTACSMPPSREERAGRTSAEVTEGTTVFTIYPETEIDGCKIVLAMVETKWDSIKDKYFIVQTIDFTNMSGKDMTFYPEYSCKAFQNGVECQTAEHVGIEKNESLTVQNGGTISIDYAFYPRDYDGVVQIAVYSDNGKTMVIDRNIVLSSDILR